MTHDYKRHGTTDLCAALNMATGQVIMRCRPGDQALRHRMSTGDATVVGPGSAVGMSSGMTNRVLPRLPVVTADHGRLAPEPTCRGTGRGQLG